MSVYDDAVDGKYKNKIVLKEDFSNIKEYREEDNRLSDLFKNDLEVEHGVSGNPKADKLWDIAWDMGHSEGYAEVALHYGNFVDLIK